MISWKDKTHIIFNCTRKEYYIVLLFKVCAKSNSDYFSSTLIGQNPFNSLAWTFEYIYDIGILNLIYLIIKFKKSKIAVSFSKYYFLGILC